MLTNLDSIKFGYSEEDKALFDDVQRGYFDNIPKNYLKLKAYCFPEVEMLQSGTHKEWIRSRIKLYVTTSVMRLLYLTESFTNASENFNAVTAAIHTKAMVEIPLHLAYLTWIVSERRTFEEMRKELEKITWGIKDNNTSLTYKSSITQKELYENADLVTKKEDAFLEKKFGESFVEYKNSVKALLPLIY